MFMLKLQFKQENTNFNVNITLYHACLLEFNYLPFNIKFHMSFWIIIYEGYGMDENSYIFKEIKRKLMCIDFIVIYMQAY